MQPKNNLLNSNNSPFFVDYYELSMGQADLENNNNAIATANYYIRKVPQGQYLITAGLEQVINFILNLSFDEGHLRFLQEKCNLNEKYIDELSNFRFTGDVWAIPEGTVVFPNEPIINITGPTRDIQLFETLLLNIMNYQTLIATKASRIKYVLEDRPFFDFGARRAHGRDAALLCARASYIGGASGTSLVAASYEFDIPYIGTMAHKFVCERENELQAFREYARAFPKDTVVLIDTYDTLHSGLKNAIIVAKEMEERGEQLKGVRLDSGNLEVLSKQVRNILNENELYYVNIIATDELDEYKIHDLNRKNAPIDAFGVGTRLATAMSSDEHHGIQSSSLSGVYKLVESNGRPVKKESKDNPLKKSIPYTKQVYRSERFDYFYKDFIVKKEIDPNNKIWEGPNERSGYPLLQPIIEQGKLVYSFPKIQKIQDHTKIQLKKLVSMYRHLNSNIKYPVMINEFLHNK